MDFIHVSQSGIVHSLFTDIIHINNIAKLTSYHCENIITIISFALHGNFRGG